MKIASAVVALACAAVPLTATAGDGRWTSGYGQGQTEATVTNARGTTFYVTCPDAALGRAPTVTLEPRGVTGGQDTANVGVLIMVDNRSTHWPLNRRVLDQGQVIFTADAVTPTQKTQLRALMQRMRAGRSVTVAIPSAGLRETFPLTGSAAALGACEVR